MAQDKQPKGGMTVEELVSLPHLGTRVEAGHAGVQRRITQANVVDAQRPWDFVDSGDLVMTSGWILPNDPQDQVAFIERMNAEGVSALTTSGDPSPMAPYAKVSPEMVEAAERIGFPLLSTEYSMAWTHLIQAVAAASGGEEALSQTHILRVHHEVRLSMMERRPSAAFLDSLGNALDASAFLVDLELWEAPLPDCELPGAEWMTALRDALDERRGMMPNVLRLRVGEQLALVVGLPVEEATVAIVIPRTEHIPRLAALQHVAAACALEMSRIDAGIERERRAGAEMLSAALEGRLDPSVFESGQRERGFEPPWYCVAIQADHQVSDRLARRWGIRSLPHLLTGLEPNYVVLISAGDESLAELESFTADEGFRAGVSDPFASSGGLVDASRQARWALETLVQGGAGLAHYGLNSDLFLPRTLAEAKLAAESTLGPLLDYDRKFGSELVETLRVYLERNRSPKQAAEQLFVHNQTIHYRIKRIEELTGRSLRATPDVSYLWFGLRALALSSEGD